MKRLIALLAALILVPNSGFSFAHLWQIQEVYTNASGSVQFVELFDTTNGEGFLTSGDPTFKFLINGATVNTLTFSNSTATDGTGDLPSGTANHSFLIGTANMTALFGITPDYIIPANFFSKGAQNSVVFSNSGDTAGLANLPTDGLMSLNASTGGVNSQASATNFADLTRPIPEPTGAILVGAGLLVGILFIRNRRGLPVLR